MKASLIRLTQHKAFAPLIILALFLAYFVPLFWGRGWWIVGDTLVYNYPLREAAWQMLRRGEAPTWTPLLLSGYPLLAMAQLSLGYPLTWFYAVLPGYVAETIYVLSAYLLSPLFLYFYLRRIGRSRLAALLGGLSFGYGGFMAGPLSHSGIVQHSVLWLPLFLCMLERARTEHFWRPLCGATLFYLLAVLAGSGQGFLYSGIIALGYGSWLAFEPGSVRVRWRWQPLAVAAGAIALAAGLSAWQTLETWQAQLRSQRATLTYEYFSGGAFTLRDLWRGFLLPCYERHGEVAPTVALLTGLLALWAAAVIVKAPRSHWRMWFWLVLTLLGFLLMQGDATPLYRVLYQVPLVNKFRVPSRHAFEFTLGLSVLAAFGWDQVRDCLRQRQRAMAVTKSHQAIGAVLCVSSCLIASWSWRVAEKIPFQAVGTGLPESYWLGWKAVFTLSSSLTVVWAWRRMQGNWQTAVLTVVVLSATFWESSIYFSHIVFQASYSSAEFKRDAPAARFMQQARPDSFRVYTSGMPGLGVATPANSALPNLSARYGVANAAGYEPLMPDRYRRAFGLGFDFATPDFAQLSDPQLRQPDCQVLDLLNVRYLGLYDLSPTLPPRRQGNGLFAYNENNLSLSPGQTTRLGGSSLVADQISFIGSMSMSADLEQGTPVALVSLRFADGSQKEIQLKAGVDLAEWSCDRPDVKATMRHQRAAIFDSTPVNVDTPYESHRFWAMHALGVATVVREATIKNLTARASLGFSSISLVAIAVATAQPTAVMLKPSLPPQWRLVHEDPQAQVFENPQVLPRVWLTPQAEAVTAPQARERIRGESAPRLDPRRTALLEIAATTLPSALTEGAALSANAQARLTNYAATHLTIETSAEQPTVLMVSERFDPGWQATLDGRAAKIYAADYLLRGLILPAGQHRIEMRYVARGARWGALISLVTLLAWLAVGWRVRRSSKDRRQRNQNKGMTMLSNESHSFAWIPLPSVSCTRVYSSKRCVARLRIIICKRSSRLLGGSL